MPDIKDTVGDGATNNPGDVAIVQVMLRVIKDAKGNAYLAGDYDGAPGPVTKAAITSFQLDNKLAKKAPPPGAKAAPGDKLGVVTPKTATFKQLVAAIPAKYKPMRVIPGGKTVYLPGTLANAQASSKTVTAKVDLEATFRGRVAKTVQGTYKDLGIELWVTKSGWRRNFAQQAALVKTNAGPGESNHNFGRAVDIGFKDLAWIKGDGSIVKDDYWLNRMYNMYDKKKKVFKTGAFWNARDAIAKANGIFPLNFERIHLQAWAHKKGLERRSLAVHLGNVGTMKWKAVWGGVYNSDLGFGGQPIYPVGTAKRIWAGLAPVTKKSIAAAKNAAAQKAAAKLPGGLKGFKPITPGHVTAKDLAAMRKALKADFEVADKHWKKWKPIP